MVKPPLRTKSIGFKVSEEEYARLETAAQASGRTLGEWCREAILRGGSASDDPALAEIVGVRSLYQYRRPIKQREDMPLVKATRTDADGRFDFGEVAPGHYTLIVDDGDWGSSNWFDVEVKQQAKQTAAITIDVSPNFPDCKGGHEFIARTTETGTQASAATSVPLFLFALGVYVGGPALMVWGWARWFRRTQPRTVPAILSLIGFTLATASGLLAVSSVLYAHAIGGFPFYDPRLLRIYRWGGLLSLSGLVFGIAGIWRPGPVRWLAPVCSFGTLLFWFASAMGE